MTNYLEVTNLSKSFDSFQLHNISFTLPKGYIMGLIGPNGSGKTTTIKLILNISKLRKKLRFEPDLPNYIESVAGIGYKFEHL